MATRKLLTDRYCQGRPPAPKGKRDVTYDSLLPTMALSVTDTGAKSLVLFARYPSNPKNWTDRSLGSYPATTLDDARDKGRRWLQLVTKGIDPRVQEERDRAAALAAVAHTWSQVVEDYIAGPGGKLAKAAEMERALKDDLGQRWGRRPIGEITTLEVAIWVKGIARRSKSQARNSLGYVSAFFTWVVGTALYGVTVNPCAALKPKALFGAKVARQRVLTDEELRWVWVGTDALVSPEREVIRLLIITAQREREIADAAFAELQPADWRETKGHVSLVIPEGRMKGRIAHLVPLVPEAVALFAKFTKSTEGDYVFSHTDGAKAVSGFGKTKRRLDQAIVAARAEARAGKGAKAEPQDFLRPWVFHDLRRTARTRFSALPVEEVVREAAIAHKRKGIAATYDLHQYEDEKRHLLTLWAARLRSIVEPAPDNVVVLKQAAQ